jgi:hypothetical protein
MSCQALASVWICIGNQHAASTCQFKNQQRASQSTSAENLQILVSIGTPLVFKFSCAGKLLKYLVNSQLSSV